MKYNKRNLIISIVALALGLVFFVVSLVFYIQSVSVYADEWEKANGTMNYGSDVSFDMNMVIGMVIGVIFLAFGGYALYNTLKDKDSTFGLYVSNIVASAIIGVYCFQGFFKPMIKLAAKGEAFVYQDYQVYLYFSIIALVLFALLLVLFVKFIKKNPKSNV